MKMDKKVLFTTAFAAAAITAGVAAVITNKLLKSRCQPMYLPAPPEKDEKCEAVKNNKAEESCITEPEDIIIAEVTNDDSLSFEYEDSTSASITAEDNDEIDVSESLNYVEAEDTQNIEF